MLALISYLLAIAAGYLILHNAVQLSKLPFPLYPAYNGNFYPYAAVFLILTTILLAMLAFIPKITKTILKVYFLFLVFSTSLLFFSDLVFPYVLNTSIIAGVSFLVSIVVCVIYYKTSERFFNLWAIFIAVMSSVLLGLPYSQFFAILLVIFIAVYDYLSVFLTKHMQFLVKTILSMDKIPQFFIIDGPIDSVKERFEKKEKKKKDKNKRKSNLLGLGDIIIPAAYAVSFITASIWFSVILVFAAFFGLCLNFLIIKKYQTGLPAIPLIVAPQLAITGVYFALISQSQSGTIIRIFASLLILPLVYILIRYTASLRSKILAKNEIL